LGFVSAFILTLGVSVLAQEIITPIFEEPVKASYSLDYAFEVDKFVASTTIDSATAVSILESDKNTKDITDRLDKIIQLLSIIKTKI